MIQKFSQNIISKIHSYVYIYIDPRTDEIFYVGKGKGKGNRCLSHLSDQSESDKVKRIQEIREESKEPIIEMLIHGVPEDVALKVEASVIDLLDLKKLTNKNRGHSSSKIGRMSLKKLVSIYEPEKANISEPSLLIKITRSFSYSLSPHELYDATRQFWRVGIDRERVECAFAVFDGLIQEVYKVVSWHKAGTTFSSRRPAINEKDRWEFVGRIADSEIRDKYIYKDVSEITNNQTSFYYLNIKEN
ncbi:MAG: hypothetical protein ACJAS1_005404 [Oleiphilaceae bacterium]|jgi:hypothetical protein